MIYIGIRIKLLTLICMVAISSCIDPISFETDSAGGELVFFGNFTQLKEKHIFNISRTSDLGEPVIPVPDALVVIKDNLGNSAIYEEIEPGKYELEPDSLTGVPGRSYHIEITLNSGKTYCSTRQVMPEPITVENIYFKIDQIQELSSSDIIVDMTVIDIYIDTPLQKSSGESSGLRWIVDEVYAFTDLKCHSFFDAVAITCYFNIPMEDPEVKLFKSEDGTQEKLTVFKVHSRLLAPDDEFIEKHYFSIRQYAISDQAYNYWEKVKLVANQSGNLFDVPPASITGNIYETESQSSFALGFFEVSGQNIARIYTLPSLIGSNEIIKTCPDMRSQIIQDKCCFCWLLDEEENRVERPEYW